MYNRLTSAIKKRIIEELRRYWSYDPVYRDDLVGHIQGKYSFRQRPCMAIILKGASANHIAMAADNFQGTVVSYCHATKVGDYNGGALEWILEDARAIADNGGVFPSTAGIYYIDIREETINTYGTDELRRVFYVDPLHDVIDEQPAQLTAFTHQLTNYPIHAGSLRLFELPGNIPMVEDINYTVDATTGVITLPSPLPTGVFLSADYRYPGTSTGPHLIKENHTHTTAIPGVVLAFGRRIEAGDVMAVIVGDRREAVALEYGGRWNLSLDLDVMALDLIAQGEITDRTLVYLQGVLRSRLSGEGIEIMEVSHGGESEEIYDETADDYFYNASISMSLETEWSIHVPVDKVIRQVVPQTSADIAAAAAMSDDELITDGEPNRLQMVAKLPLKGIQDPFFVGRSKTFEVIR